MSTFLVTGVNGCLGAWVTRLLLQAGHTVVGADLARDMKRLQLVAAEALEAAGGRFTFAQVDLCDRPALEALVAAHPFRAVIHLAALQMPFCKADPVRGMQVNVGGMLHLLEIARAHPFRLVYASSTAVYGPSTGRPLGEHDNLRPASLYGIYKLADEQMAAVYAADHGVASAGLRPWVIYGPARDQGMTADVTLALAAAAAGQPFHIRFGGETWLSYVEDVARAFIAAAEGDKPGARVYNLGGELLPLAAVARHIEEAAGVRGLVTCADAAVPIATETSDDAFQRDHGPFAWRGLADGLRNTLTLWRERGAS